LTRLLLNFSYAQPVGHAVEALHYANGYHLGGAEVSVALNAATPGRARRHLDYVTPPSASRSADRR
jgi:hypothetical protein